MHASPKLATLLRDGAGSHPARTAFTENGLGVPYGRVHQDVETLARRLIEHGICPGDLVGIHIGGSAAHWSLLLALMRVGGISVSLTSRYRAEIEALPVLSALLCAIGQGPMYGGTRTIEVDRHWLTGPPPSADLPDARTVEGSIGRICFTSGTSGAPKAILLDAETLAHRLSGTAGRSRISAGSVLWCGLGVDTAYGLTATLATWMAGGTVLFAARREDVLNGGVNLVIASPAALQALRPPAAGGAARRIDGTVVVAGGRLSNQFLQLRVNRTQ